ncbi:MULTISPECIES: 23S rRNA (adenine(2030)-N(6))-methyltransferase RlmJ [unclassified Mesorhizobium]|uniref:23S rRNA (adenine(2030)-N(6))-methyltransferase RlmJ n=1 Tax=unclassified Mesorhizobium TaxID=325217 RepID=UPI000BAEF05E|nr:MULTISPECIES: 23S rRNA (adenine(2030)-N(6))-methyltransferase RlmJ [unclassified Mesorhizobium]TGT61177.1 23S rRNA (adenine(2030)-N(6))-methyltransferase RlmJ [Mesorhizobium sp. M00.F.Ca.ET.170.01.1.1]AZO08943.1 23S rRNA (adenine(2030)-N(6))-methyltransferase RlmJ [Mesorhizobium sp. M3A.F.Ca.ET.080.04.2.1]PBB84191.1 23S rRNA (adenine(2030)-N(6))-methyltransferase RlmJ [Mesorhizobium sp. WSM3876]RWB84586.1 MAG: 23S rRNA (adenine(2030)-N(6))-methyltransferase RlmJ [Mesorhizobium sp.]RWE26485.
MNYRHAYHAGNFADVVKHAVLCRLVDYLKQKDKAFRVIDTHAGVGRYDLASVEAGKTGEWQGGIGRLIEASLEPPAAALLQSYLEAVRAENPEGGLRRYPGSPLVARHLLRKQDRLTAIELHPRDAAQLKSVFAGDFQTRVIELDGWLALGAHLPPKEKRGLVLVDPPFEEEGEFARLTDNLRRAHRRWPGGIYALWYPIKDRKAVAAFRSALKQAGIPKMLDIAFDIRPASNEPSLDGSGMVVVNPPFTLEGELRVLLPALHKALAVKQPSRWTVEWLAGEQGRG